MTNGHLGAVVAAFSGRKSARSQTYQWLLSNYNELAAARKTGRRVDWVGVTAELKKIGLKSDGGKALKTETVRRAFQRVDADVKAGIANPGGAPPRPVQPVRPPVRALPPVPKTAHDDIQSILSDSMAVPRINKR